MKRFVLLLVAAGWFVPLFCRASADPFLDGQIQLVQSQIQHYVNMAHVLEVLTALVAAVGVIIAILQPADFNRKKMTLAALGTVSALIVIVNQTFFPADYRAYNKVASQARIKVKAFSRQLEILPTLDDATKASLHQQFASLQNDIDQLEYTTIDNATQSSVSTHSFSFLSEVWAQSVTGKGPAVPDWAKQVPVDGNLYYLGVADGKSFAEAQANALANARIGASSAFVRGAVSTKLAGKPELIQQLTDGLGAVAEPAQTFVAPTPSGEFRGYVLLRLSRSAALFVAQSIFVEAGVPYDQTFLNRITGEAAVNPAQKKIARVYLHIASESQRPTAQAIQKALVAANYLVPGIQNVAGKGYIPDTLEVRYFAPASKAEAEKILGLIKSQGAKDGRSSYVIPTAQDMQISTDINTHFEVWAGKNSF